LLANETADLASKHDLKYSYKFVQWLFAQLR
jgi:hypothetical protein